MDRNVFYVLWSIALVFRKCHVGGSQQNPFLCVNIGKKLKETNAFTFRIAMTAHQL